MMKLLTTLAATTAPLLARAHGGHGLPGEVHWHADDALKILGLSLVALVALWLLRRK